MGAAESTGRSNGIQEEEEEQRRQGAGESSTGAAAAVAMAAAGAAFAAWGVSKMLSDNAETRKNEEAMSMEAPVVPHAGYNGGPPHAGYNGGPPHAGYNGGPPHASYNGGPPHGGYNGGPPHAAAGAAFALWGVSHSRIYKMKTDGACRPNHGSDLMRGRGPSGYGGILRDDNGKWVRGFRGFIGESDCLTAEFHGILNGLLVLDKLGLEESVLESDSAPAVEWIENEKYRRRTPVIQDCWDMIQECKRLIQKNRIMIRSISRDANKCADKLANMGIDKQEPYCVEIMELPAEIKSIFARESAMV